MVKQPSSLQYCVNIILWKTLLYKSGIGHRKHKVLITVLLINRISLKTSPKNSYPVAQCVSSALMLWPNKGTLIQNLIPHTM